MIKFLTKILIIILKKSLYILTWRICFVSNPRVVRDTKYRKINELGQDA